MRRAKNYWRLSESLRFVGTHREDHATTALIESLSAALLNSPRSPLFISPVPLLVYPRIALKNAVNEDHRQTAPRHGRCERSCDADNPSYERRTVPRSSRLL